MTDLSEPAPSQAQRLTSDVGTIVGLYGRVEIAQEMVYRAAARIGLPLLRMSLGITFLWFGALKLTNSTPVARLVADTVPFLPAKLLVPALGVLEAAIGVGLLMRRWTTAVVAIMIAHLTGTFLVLVTQPDVAFQGGNPLMLTMTGEFVVKNLILISAGLVLVAARPQLTRPPETKDEATS